MARSFCRRPTCRSRQSQEAEERRQFMFDSLVAGTSLQESLLEQMRFSDLTTDQKPIAEMIIGNIDDRRLSQGHASMSCPFPPALPRKKSSAVLKIIQKFHPPGVAARDLRECLMLQLERAGREEDPGIPHHPRFHGRAGQTQAAGNRARPGRQCRASPGRRGAHRPSGASSRPRISARQRPLHFPGSLRAKSGRRLRRHHQQRTNSPPAHQQPLTKI